MLLALEQRLRDDPGTLGSLFYACCDEVSTLLIGGLPHVGDLNILC